MYTSETSSLNSQNEATLEKHLRASEFIRTGAEKIWNPIKDHPALTSPPPVASARRSGFRV